MTTVTFLSYQCEVGFWSFENTHNYMSNGIEYSADSCNLSFLVHTHTSTTTNPCALILPFFIPYHSEARCLLLFSKYQNV